MQLNLEQKKIIQSKPSGHMLVKGVAGSGKTTVAVHRVPFLLKNYCYEEDDGILLVTYNKLLIQYVKYIYEKMDRELDIVESSLLEASADEKLDIKTVDGIMYKYFNDFKRENNLNINIIRDNRIKYSILAESISELSKEYKGVRLLDPKYIDFLLDEIDWIKSCNYMELEEYQNTNRLGRTNKQSSDGPQKLMKNSDTRKAIFELMNLYNKKLKELGYIDFKDMGLIAYKQAKKNVDKKYNHIIIDESQDLTRVQLKFLKLLFLEKEYSSLIFICDTAQSIYPHSWLVKGRSFTSIGFDMTGKSNSLSKNYRTTTQIAEAAYSLIEDDENIIENENYVEPALIDRQGEYPVCKYFNSQYGEAEFIISEIKNRLLNKYKKRDIAIIARNRSLIEYMESKLDAAGIDSTIISSSQANFEKDGVRLLTMHSIKGLEFEVVFIIGLNKDIIPFLSYQDLNDESMQESMDKKLFYVGMTRANELLYLTSSGMPSKFFKDINNKYLKLDTLSKVKRFYNIDIDNYKFKNEIINLYSKEEKIRQWFIKELMETYKYPKSLIDVEYKVNNFSRVGSVDICISIYRNGEKIPFIFVETKSFGAGLENGLRQVKSYMSCCKTCQYGVVVDGNEILIIDKDFELVNDIPLFTSRMLPSSIENYKYISLKSNKESILTMDINNKADIMVENLEEKRNYKNEELINIPVYTNIAAGEAMYMNEEIVDIFPLPKSWIKCNDHYILKIKGDSMIETGIGNGDYVVVRKQDVADNRDIVAVAIENEATLKRFMKMGSTILLIPENEKYEPIQLTGEQIRILGVAVGVIKKVNS